MIRKLFRFEAAHIVRGCSTDRCRWNIHGHSFKVELMLRSDTLDNAGMVMDFSLMKPWIKDLFESVDHSYLMWSQESEEFKQSIREMSRRWVDSLSLLQRRTWPGISTGLPRKFWTGQFS